MILNLCINWLASSPKRHLMKLGGLDDINNYQINIVFSARKLAEASFNETWGLDDINNYQLNIVFSARKLAEA